MNCPDAVERLDAYLARTLSAEDSAGLEQHLLACEACRGEFRFLRTLRSEASGLPSGFPPERDLWSGIAARLREHPARPAPVWHRTWFLAAAAVVLVTLSSVVTAAMLARGPAVPAGAGSEISLTETAYRRAADDLWQVVQSRRDKLAPGTLEVIRHNLQIIDTAIEETEAALAKDPGNLVVANLLWATYERKLDFLRRAADDVAS